MKRGLIAAGGAVNARRQVRVASDWAAKAVGSDKPAFRKVARHWPEVPIWEVGPQNHCAGAG